jgi:hypothetical protein
VKNRRSRGRIPGLCLLGFFAAFPGAAVPPTAPWQDFSPPGGGFSIRLPGTPTELTASPGGLHQYELKIGDQDDVVSYADLPPEMKGLPPEQILERLRDDFVKSVPGSTLVRSKPFQLGGHPGITWVLEASVPDRPTFRMKMAAVVTRDRLFHYGVIARSDLFDEVAVDRYLETFQLLSTP